jgi:heme/copper-type cytochrome/quinol oxidase subunit 3
MPGESYWPFVLAHAMVILCIGMVAGITALWVAAIPFGGVAVAAWLWPPGGLAATASNPPEHGLSSLPGLGMALFILTESALFALVFATYLYLRSGASEWPPSGVELPKLGIPLVNTALLVTSSGCMVAADVAARRRHIGQLRGALAAAFLLGATFLALQLSEYANEPMHLSDSAYSSLFFVVTGFHGLHVAAGLAMIGYVQVLAWSGRLRRESSSLTNASWYWHFVDAIWILVLLTVYLSPRFAGT